MTGFSLPENFGADLERLLRKARALKIVFPSTPVPPEEEPVSKVPILMAEKSLH